jgi:hypothetical protein
MKLLQVSESLEVVMDEVRNRVSNMLPAPTSRDEKIALSTFYGTMTKITLDVLDKMDLTDEGKEDILTVCGTWLDIGLLMSRPKLLVAILKKVKPKISGFTPPEWWHEKDRAIAEAESIIHEHD